MGSASKEKDGKRITILPEGVMTLNTEEAQVVAQVRLNIRRHLPQVQPYEQSERGVLLIGGGPSLNDYADEIREKHDEGYALVAVNGAGNWLQERDIGPFTQVIMDARDFNARFVRDPRPENVYLLASQCHPDVFDAVADMPNVNIWHAGAYAAERAELSTYYIGNNWFAIPGGSTVILRALPLLRMLGFERFEIYGFDSCLTTDEAHHAYEQPENDCQQVVVLELGGRKFLCHPWMISQAEEFINQTVNLGHMWKLSVKGDGLIAHIIKTGATALPDRPPDKVGEPVTP